ncbi:MarR family transcriptional regulator [Olsenella profusa]|uniref:MarR family transcriptional regulator n=1 Tax=Olsenella profusa TaxID=138595 RepID=A0ABS2F0U8_9ACTN|nr:MarR family transcriptional regulator [Olsenella profusa]MBM6774487.1 MarR family transcriptional regulator [Olsenella profusa]
MSNADQRAKAAPKRLTPTERRILLYVAEREGKSCSKAEMAEALGRNRKTIDRLVAHLREEGLIVSKPVWDKNGAQLPNSYRLARNKDARRAAEAASEAS